MAKGVQNMINSAQAKVSTGGRTKTAPHPGNPGPETKAKTSAAGLNSNSVLGGEAGLNNAVKELHRQHPHKHDDLGPHHGGSDNVRHMALGGMKSCG